SFPSSPSKGAKLSIPLLSEEGARGGGHLYQPGPLPVTETERHTTIRMASGHAPIVHSDPGALPDRAWPVAGPAGGEILPDFDLPRQLTLSKKLIGPKQVRATRGKGGRGEGTCCVRTQKVLVDARFYCTLS